MGTTAGSVVALRREVFEYGVLPLSPLLKHLTSPAALAPIQQRLLALPRLPCSPAPHHVVDVAAAAEAIGLSHPDALLLTDTLASVAPDAALSTPEGVDAHWLLLFLFVQTYLRPHAQSQVRETGEVWPGDGRGGRLPATKHSSSDDARQLAFVRRHLAAVLSLARDQAGAGGELGPAEFDRLELLFSTGGSALSGVVPLFAGAPRLPAATLERWLGANLAPPGQDEVGRMPVDDLCVEGLSKGTVVKREGDVGSGTVRIMNCHDSVVYVLAPVRFVAVVGCTDCTIFIGAVGQAMRVEHCERVNVVVSCVRIQLRSCRDSDFYLGVNRSPLLLGDNRNLQLAPYNTFYDSLSENMAAAGVLPSPNLWDKPATLAPAQAPKDGHTVAVPLPPERYLPFIVPFRCLAPSAAPAGTQANPFLVPHAYAVALDRTMTNVSRLRTAVRDAKLDDTRRHELQATIQAYFKEWLMVSGNMRQVYDLARIERGEA